MLEAYTVIWERQNAEPRLCICRFLNGKNLGWVEYEGEEARDIWAGVKACAIEDEQTLLAKLWQQDFREGNRTNGAGG
jgi:hypothetical protein